MQTTNLTWFVPGVGEFFHFTWGLERKQGPCIWGIITFFFYSKANAPYFPGVGVSIDRCITDKKLALKGTIATNNDMSKNNKQTAVSYKRNETTHVVKTFIYELDVSYAPTYIFRSNGYLNYN